jgi:hypothetical protein
MSFNKVVVAENNLGQLSIKIKAELKTNIYCFNDVRGRPLIVSEIESKVKSLLKGF